MAYARVALDVPLGTLFDYACPDLREDDVGRIVVVPFGRTRRVGVIMGVAEAADVPDGRIRTVVRVVRNLPSLPRDLLALLEFCSRYYHHPLGATVMTAVPTGLRRVEARALLPRVDYVLTGAGEADALARLPRRAVAQRALLARFQAAGRLSSEDVRALGGSARPALRALMAAGYVCAVSAGPGHDRRCAGSASNAESRAESHTAPELTADQRAAVETIARSLGAFRCHLLQGITGSGKTEVYFRLIEAVLARGEQALLLVPEINLTPQLESRIAQRFAGERVATLHSGLAEGERAQRWLEAVRGEASIVVGTRLAVFTPLPRLGLVVVDEEHDGSYKQQEGLRYHARDVAVLLGKRRGVPVVLGSATPSLESFRQGLLGRYVRVTLPSRAASAVPRVETVDTTPLASKGGISPQLEEAIRGTLARGEQTLLFLNRRGFAPTLLCHACGWVAPCHRCSARLTIHTDRTRLQCHYCGHEERVPVACPACGNQDLRALGEGTQRIEGLLGTLFPDARVARVDRDSTRRRHAFRDLRQRIADHDVDIIVGTQMLAKGHDFPRLTLVGVLGADAALHAADFRAEERLFSLLLQVAGRAGRGALPGRVLIQTAFPTHPLYRAVASQDYDAFARAQLQLREETGFPPFLHQALLRAEATDEHAVRDFLVAAAAMAGAPPQGVTLYDPVPALVPRIAGKWRGQLLIQAVGRSPLHGFLEQWLPRLPAGRVRWSIDVDPLDF
jgi:primosomal protein N' (replication factor Y)